MMGTRNLDDFGFTMRKKLRVRQSQIKKSEMNSRTLQELKEIGNKITGSYSLIEFPGIGDKPNSGKITIIETLQMIPKIIKIRGLTRYILQVSLRNKNNSTKMNSKSRILVCWDIFVNYKLVLETMRSIKMINFNIEDLPKKFIIAPNFPWEQEQITIWSQEKYCVIPSRFQFKLINLRLESNDSKKYLIIKLCNHSPKIFWRILNELTKSLTLSNYNYLFKKKNIISVFLSIYKKLNYVVVSNSHLTVDEVSKKSNPIKKIHNAEIWHSIYIIKDGNWIIRDITEHPKQQFVAGHSHFASRNSKEVELLVPKEKLFTIESGFLLTKRCETNWYHFLFDLLPQTLLLKKLSVKTKIIVRDDLPDTAKAILKYLHLNTIFVSVNSRIYVKNLYYIPHRSSVFDTQVRVGDHPRVLFSEKAILKLRASLNKFEPNNEKFSINSKIFIPRIGRYRNCKNLDKVEQELSKQGFRKFSINNYYLRNQFAIFRNSNLIVVSGGAIAANMIFMKKNTSMVILGSWRSASLGIWGTLGRILGVKTTEVNGIPTRFTTDRSKNLHSDYIVPKVLLRYYLKK